jgi:hypothetical protein
MTASSSGSRPLDPGYFTKKHTMPDDLPSIGMDPRGVVSLRRLGRLFLSVADRDAAERFDLIRQAQELLDFWLRGVEDMGPYRAQSLVMRQKEHVLGSGRTVVDRKVHSFVFFAANIPANQNTARRGERHVFVEVKILPEYVCFEDDELPCLFISRGGRVHARRQQFLDIVFRDRPCVEFPDASPCFYGAEHNASLLRFSSKYIPRNGHGFVVRWTKTNHTRGCE